MATKTINEERTRELYTEAVAQAGGRNDRNAVLSGLYMLIKPELESTEWPTTNDQYPYGFAIFEILSTYGQPPFNPYAIWSDSPK